MFPILILSVEILSGQHIPRPQGVEEGEVIDPYVEVIVSSFTNSFWVISIIQGVLMNNQRIEVISKAKFHFDKF